MASLLFLRFRTYHRSHLYCSLTITNFTLEWPLFIAPFAILFYDLKLDPFFPPVSCISIRVEFSVNLEHSIKRKCNEKVRMAQAQPLMNIYPKRAWKLRRLCTCECSDENWNSGNRIKSVKLRSETSMAAFWAS